MGVAVTALIFTGGASGKALRMIRTPRTGVVEKGPERVKAISSKGKPHKGNPPPPSLDGG